MRKKVSLLFCLVIVGLQIVAVSAQNAEKLTATRKPVFSLGRDEEKSFTIDLKKDDFAEIAFDGTEIKPAIVTISAPSGEKLLDEVYFDSSYLFIAKETGVYRLSVKPDKELAAGEKLNLTAVYIDKFNLPKGAKLVRQRKAAGYDAKVYNVTTDDDFGTYLLIEKNGKLKEIQKGGSVVGGGYQFADDPKLWDYAEGKKSATLFRTTPDKTGDGTPDIAVQFYTGGAHCCFQMTFFELGQETVKAVKPINGNDSDVIAVGKKPNGSLIIRTGDSNFAYWLMSFAGSPIPTVILSFQDGEFRADAPLMKKRPPTLAVLKVKAAKAKKNMDLKAYTGEVESHFSDAFWGEMLDLMYAGNETAAWQFFDSVWDKRKPGREKFKQDFTEQLNKSPYWQTLAANRK